MDVIGGGVVGVGIVGVGIVGVGVVGVGVVGVGVVEVVGVDIHVTAGFVDVSCQRWSSHSFLHDIEIRKKLE